MISSILNIVLDLLFIIVFKIGVTGAALATIISQGVSCLLCVILILTKFLILRLRKKDVAMSKEKLVRL
ncbi:MAG: polysaccharide biosynthesis C-terminal domain-containing protein [Treponema sp.]|nr:polysaccharide biosynthesis C-terminal domain-containing protein [Treponema sp.]